MELFVWNKLEIGRAVRRVGQQTTFTLTEIVGSIWKSEMIMLVYALE